MIIETDNLSKRFSRHDAVRGVNFSVAQGSAVALIGANGAGKSTLMRLLVNALRPDGGNARVLGIDSKEISHVDYQRIGYVSENVKLPALLTIAQFFDYLRALYVNWDRTLEEELRRQLDLPADRPLGRLSHGMRMKAMLVSALAFRPALLLLDEPLSGLDPLVRDEIMSGLLGQAGETTFVISSHELSEIEHCVTHVAFMDRGRLLFQEPIEAMAERFREVEVVMRETGVPSTWPATWLGVESTRHSLRFVDSSFSSDADLARLLNERVGATRSIEVRAMSLRDISKSLMRASRNEVRQ